MFVGLGVLWSVVATSIVAAQGLATPPDPQHIIGGEPSVRGDFDGVVAIVAGSGLCTGTVVAERLVLTAGHCLTEVSSPESIQVFYGEEIDGTNAVAVEDFGVHPEFCRDCENDIFDYGYVTIAGDFTVPGGFLLPLTDQDEWDQTVGSGSDVTLVGFGEDPDADDTSASLGIKRQVDTRIRKYSPEGFEFFAGGEGQDSCQGDSGGPAFVRLDDGTWRLAGITSRGSDPCGEGGFYGTPYPALAWIREQTDVNLCGESCAECDCLDTTPKPEDEGCAVDVGSSSGAHLGLLCLLALGLRLRSRRA